MPYTMLSYHQYFNVHYKVTKQAQQFPYDIFVKYYKIPKESSSFTNQALQKNQNQQGNNRGQNQTRTIKWDFGDGTPAQTLTGTTATHTYTTAGSYNTSAVVTLNGGKCSYTKHNTVDID